MEKKKINLNIDILQIEKDFHNQPLLIGYEIKLIKFNKKNGELSWNSFYSGIGQALMYLKNGIHRSSLILGFHESIYDDELIERFYNQLQNEKELLKRIIGEYVSINMYLYKRGYLVSIVESRSIFYSFDKEVELLFNEIIQGRFTFDRKLKK